MQQLCERQGLSAGSFGSLEYHAPPLIHRLVGRPAHEGMEPGYARLCMQYLMAVTLLRGTVTLADFSREALDDSDVLALARRITVINDGNPDLAAFVPARAVARTTDGQELTQAVVAQLGSPEWPLTEQQHSAKVLGCLESVSYTHLTLPTIYSV